MIRQRLELIFQNISSFLLALLEEIGLFLPYFFDNITPLCNYQVRILLQLVRRVVFILSMLCRYILGTYILTNTSFKSTQLYFFLYYLYKTQHHLPHCSLVYNMSLNSNKRLKKVLLFSDFLHNKFTIILLLIFSHVIWAQDDRIPTDQAYLFSADAETLLGNQPLRTTFSCQGREYGYYADVANNCQVCNQC